MIFASFDAADFSLLSNVKKSIDLMKNFLTKKENLDIAEEAVRIRNIDYK